MKKNSIITSVVCFLILLLFASLGNRDSEKTDEQVNEHEEIEIVEVDTYNEEIEVTTQSNNEVVEVIEPVEVAEVVYTEEEYKNLCVSYSSSDFQTLGESMENKYVMLELLVETSKKDAFDNYFWECGFKGVTDKGIETYISAPCYLSDCRDSDSSYVIDFYDKIIIWGEVSKNPMDGYNGYYRPFIDAKYIEFVGKFGE